MAGEVLQQSDWFNWSLNQLAREFGIARETVQSRLRQCNVEPNGERRGHPVYSVAKAAKAILTPTLSTGAATNDPNLMTPQERAYWYKSERDRVQLEKEQSLAIYVHDARTEMAVIAKTGLQILETLPDILERDYNMPADVIQNVEQKIDDLRATWAELVEAE